MTATNNLKEIIRKASFEVLNEKRSSEDHVYSFSRLTTADCLKRFYHKYVLKQEEPSGPPAILGKIVHETVAGLIDPERLKDVVVPDDFDLNKELTKVEVDLAEAEKLVLAAKAKPGMGKAETYYRVSLNPQDLFAPLLQVFIDLEIPLKETSRGIIRGNILDWKTNQVDFEPTDTRQLAIYSWVLSQKYGYKEVEGFLRFLRFKGKKGLKKHVFTAEEMEEARQWAYNRACDIESRLGQVEFGGDPESLFPANPESGQCKYCSFVNECQKHSESEENSITASVAELEKGELEITTPDQAVEIAAEFLRLKAAGSKLQAALKAYCEKTGEIIEVGSQRYGLNTSISWSFSPDQKRDIAKIFANNSINPWEIFALGSAQLKDKKLNPLGWDETTYKKLGGKQKVSNVYKWTRAESAKEDKNVKVS